MEQNRMRCLNCQQQIRPIDYAIHALAVHQTVAHVCAPCAALFANAADLAAHQQLDHLDAVSELVANVPPVARRRWRRAVALRLPKARRATVATAPRLDPALVAPLAPPAADRLTPQPADLATPGLVELLPRPKKRRKAKAPTVAKPKAPKAPKAAPAKRRGAPPAWGHPDAQLDEVAPKPLSDEQRAALEAARAEEERRKAERKAEFERKFGWSTELTARERALRQHQKH